EASWMRASNHLLAVLVLLATGACSSPGGTAAADAGEDAGSTLPDAGPTTDAAGSPTLQDASDASPVQPEASDVDAAAAPEGSSPEGGIWSPVRFGVTTMDTGGGDDIVIAYGGYTATDQDSQAW